MLWSVFNVWLRRRLYANVIFSQEVIVRYVVNKLQFIFRINKVAFLKKKPMWGLQHHYLLFMIMT